jgi:nucleoside-diphosphate-sugar epimerase
MITILGASGFIGSHLTKRLDLLDGEYVAFDREAGVPRGLSGHVVYCIGVTADFRSRPFDTVEAHVCALIEALRYSRFETLLYLSSARVYKGADSTSEDAAIRISPLDASDLYNVSKAMGESLALSCGRPTRVVRLSNVYGGDFKSDNFLSSIIRDAIVHKHVVLNTSAESAKDYISIDNVVDALIQIAMSGKERLYNIASGFNVSNGQLAEALRSATGCTVEFAQDAPSVTFPTINIDRVQAELNFQPSRVLEDIPHLVDLYRRNPESSHDQS